MSCSNALMIISDGRERVLNECLVSVLKNLPKFKHVVWVDDSSHRLGFTDAIRKGWEKVLETDAEYCFHLEGDFIINRPLYIYQMQNLLKMNPHIIQFALRRNPWSIEEINAGGQIELNPSDYEEKCSGSYYWLEHKRNFTTNPSLYPRWVMEEGWPNVNLSEGAFSKHLMDKYPDKYFALWGSRDSRKDGEWCLHQEQRSPQGHGY